MGRIEVNIIGPPGPCLPDDPMTWTLAYEHFGGVEWDHVRRLARLGGMELPPSGPAVSLTAAESGRLAEAMEQALLDIPEHDAKGTKSLGAMTAVEWFSGLARFRLKNFVKLCRAGPVTIRFRDLEDDFDD
jgi:hypothetical protein